MKIGIIGGPFYWKIWQLEAEQFNITTPYGNPADSLFKGVVGEHEVITLLRHGNGNTFSPSDLPYLANVYAIGTFDPDIVIHTSLCGSLTNIFGTHPNGKIFLFDQVIDFTKSRTKTFGSPVFNSVHHLDFSTPVSLELMEHTRNIFLKNNIRHHFKGTMLTEEGPRFSTAAESQMYRIIGADAVNQTSCPEIYLLRELGIPVIAMSLITNVIDSNFVIDSQEITDSVKKFNTIIPNATKVLIEKLTSGLNFSRPKVNNYDVSKFDHR